MNRSVPIDSIVILIALADTYLIIQWVNLCKVKVLTKRGLTWLANFHMGILANSSDFVGVRRSNSNFIWCINRVSGVDNFWMKWSEW